MAHDHDLDQGTSERRGLNNDYESSERGKLNEGFIDRMDELREKAENKNGHEFHTDKTVKLALSATRGHDIRNWTTEKTKIMEPGETMTFSAGNKEFRLKLLGVERYLSRKSFRPEGLQPRVAIDRFDADTEEWVEYVECSGPENCSVVIDLSFSIETELLDENEN